MMGLRNNDARLFALQFLSAGELAAQKLDEAARSRASVRTQEPHAEQENQQLEDLRISQASAGILRRAPFCVLEKSGEVIVEFCLNEGRRPLFVNDAGGECFVGFSERLEAPKDIRIGRGLPLGAEFSDGKRDRRKKLAVRVHDIRREPHVKQRRVGRKRPRVLILVTMRRGDIAAVRRAVDGHFPLCPAAHGTDFVGFCGAKTPRFSLLTNWTNHEWSPGEAREKTEYHAMMTLLWKRRAAMISSTVPIPKRASASIHR